MLVRRINRLLGTFGSKYVLMPTQITRTISCAWCATDFEWSGSPLDNRAVFCSKGHKNKARVARNKRAEEPEATPKRNSTHVFATAPERLRRARGRRSSGTSQ